MNKTSLTAATLLLLMGSVAVAQPSDDDLPFIEVNGEKIPLFMHSETFPSNAPGWGARDAVEVEAAMTMSCIPGEELYEMLESNDRRNFRRLRRSSASEAFTTGFDLNEIPWGSKTHKVREGIIPWDDDATPIPTYVWLTIENDRFSVHPERGYRRLNMGTDIMDDIYYDTDDFMLLNNGMSIRARKRWDSDTEMRRLLIALKMEMGVDAFGIKRAAKTDVRRDSPSIAAINSLSVAVPQGNDSWNNDPAVPLRRAYETLKNRGLLESSPSYTDVLAIKPQSFIRSVRSRYHLNETSLDNMKELYELGKTRLEAIAAMAAEARMDGAIPPDRIDEVENLEAKIRDVLSGELVAERSRTALAALGFDAPDAASIADLLPLSTTPGSSSSLADITSRNALLEQRKVVSHVVSQLYHELAEALDEDGSEGLRRVITRSTDNDLRRYTDWFVDFKKSENTNLRKIRTLDTFVDLHSIASVDSTQLASFNKYGLRQRRGDDAVLAFLNADTTTALSLIQAAAISANRAQTILDGKADQPTGAWTEVDDLRDLSGIGGGTVRTLRNRLGEPNRDFRRFQRISVDNFKDVRFQIRNEQVEIWMRQIESAGSVAKGMWFDEAREFYIPSSNRAWGNFLIDTMDFAAMYSADVWGDLPPAERTAAVDLSQPPYSDKLIHATVVNEVQIELNSGGVYTDRLKELKGLTELPRQFMNWTQATSQASNPDEYKTVFEELKGLSNDELKVKLVDFNNYMRENNAAISSVDESQFRDWLSPERLREDVRDPDYSEDEIDLALEGATFVYNQYNDMLQFVSALKKDKVRDTLRDAGGDSCMEWVPTEGSKGSISLNILQRRARAAAGIIPHLGN